MRLGRLLAAAVLGLAVLAAPAGASSGADLDGLSAQGLLLCDGEPVPERIVLRGSGKPVAEARVYRAAAEGHSTYTDAVPAIVFRFSTLSGGWDRPGPRDSRLTECRLVGDVAGVARVLFPQGLPSALTTQGKTRL